MSMDILSIHQLNLETKIGVHTWEQKVLQKITIDLDLAIDVAIAAKEDNIAHTVNYDQIRTHLTEFLQNHPFQLIETLAERTTEYLMTTFNISWMRCRITKPGALRGGALVSVIIERGSRT